MAHASTSWLSGGFCQLPVLRPALTNQSLGPRHSRPYRPCVRHIGTSLPSPRPPRPQVSRTSAHGRTAHPSSSTAQSATAASPTVRVRVRVCVRACFRSSTSPSLRVVSARFPARACVWTCAAAARGVHNSNPTVRTRSVVPRLLALRRPTARQHAQTKGPRPPLAYTLRRHSSRHVPPWDARAQPGPLCTLQRRGGAFPTASQLTALAFVL